MKLYSISLKLASFAFAPPLNGIIKINNNDKQINKAYWSRLRRGGSGEQLSSLRWLSEDKEEHLAMAGLAARISVPHILFFFSVFFQLSIGTIGFSMYLLFCNYNYIIYIQRKLLVGA